MKWTGLNELREAYLKFFESKNCLRQKSYSLVPQNDKSLLLIVAGMAPLKPYFTGQEVPPKNRMVTCQRCIRTGDIENVGKTARHGTYFEMLGNFSFGDYFKKEAIEWAWEFCTKVLEIPLERLFVSVYEEDDEAEKIWHEDIGIPMNKIFRMGKEDNFWEAGVDGPCGPCSEIYYDRGEEYGCGSPDCTVGCECDRYMEFWNLVFTQFERHEDGTYTPLAQKNIDTGMGLERLAIMLQGVDSIFDVDTMKAIRDHICDIAGCDYSKDNKKDVSVRVITDHIRAVTFLASDGVIPSNEGRGYVMRRLIRRAIRHGKLLGINGLFLKDLVRTVVDCNKCEYNELEERYDYIVKLLTNEEKNFNETIDRGMNILNGYINELADSNSKVLDGHKCFILSDTYGFPIDLTREILEEKGLEYDEESFKNEVEIQRQTARNARGGSKFMGSDETIFHKLSKDFTTDFDGYDKFEIETNIDFITTHEDIISSAQNGDEVYIISKVTPFYAESGGQVSDNGIITTETGKCTVIDVQKVIAGKFAHKAVVIDGNISVGQTAKFTVDNDTRLATMRNHTTAHLLQSALREVLGDHVHQAGQMVDSKRLRFDFSHFSAVTEEELAKVEQIVNQKIMEAIPVSMVEMPIEQAQSLGAMALFGEKYGNVVRVVSIDDYSIEFCGGTHVDNTSKIGLFKILSENSVSAGIRRIEAVTGLGVLDVLNDNINTMRNTAVVLKAPNITEIVNRAGIVMLEHKALEKSFETLREEISKIRVEALSNKAINVNGVNVVTAMFSPLKGDSLRVMGDRIRDIAPNLIAVIAGVDGENGQFLVACGKDAVAKGAHAGKMVKEIAAITGGKGGGRPDSAMAGVGDRFKIDEALDCVKDIVAEFIK